MPSRSIMIAVLVVLGAAGAWAWARGQAGNDGPSASAISTAAPGSEALYLRYCGEACHGPDGVMVDGVSNAVRISGQDFLASVDDDYLFWNIKLGRPGENGRGRPGTKMSGFGIETEGGPPPILTDAQIRDLVSYVRSWQTRAPVEIEAFDASEGRASEGAVTYAANCAACHGEDGWGEIGPRLAGATFQARSSDGLIRHVVSNGRAGTAMPAFKQFDDAEMADLIAFIRGLDDA